MDFRFSLPGIILLFLPCYFQVCIPGRFRCKPLYYPVRITAYIHVHSSTRFVYLDYLLSMHTQERLCNNGSRADKSKFTDGIAATIVALAPMLAPFLIRVFLYSFLRLTALRGFITFVSTTPGPRKTSSSQVTPSYRLTLF